MAPAFRYKIKPAQIGVLGEVADVLLHVVGVDLMVSPWRSGAAGNVVEQRSIRSAGAARRCSPPSN
jgi:hypothetical protein